jgi:hypothetical protein
MALFYILSTPRLRTGVGRVDWHPMGLTTRLGFLVNDLFVLFPTSAERGGGPTEGNTYSEIVWANGRTTAHIKAGHK